MDQSVPARATTGEHPLRAGESNSHRVAAMVYNPAKVDLDRLREAVREVEAAADWARTLWFPTDKDDSGLSAARQAVSAGADVVIAAGGDGTVRAVAEGIHGSHATLALLPSGTGNLLARNLDLTLGDLHHSLTTAFTGDTRTIDLGLIDIHRQDGSVDQHAYLVMAGLGLDAKMLANTDDDLKKRIGWLAYVSALADAIRDKNRLRIRYRLDSAARRTASAHTVIVGNCGLLPANIMLLPDAAIDDGLFDILLLRPEGALGWIQIFVKVLWENGVLRRTRWGKAFLTREVSALRYVKAKTLEVQLEHAEEIELDGDSFGQAIGFSTRVDADGIAVRVPAGG